MAPESEDTLSEGIRLLQSGEYESAVNEFMAAVSRSPSDASAYSYLGIAHSKLGNVDAGVAALQAAVQLKPDDTGYLYNLAVALKSANRAADARDALLRVIELEPENQRAKSALLSLQSESASQTSVGPIYGGAPLDIDQNPDSRPVPPGQESVPSSVYPYASVYGSEPPAAGMAYAPPPLQAGYAPPLGLRIMRGLGWGALWGQWWTAWMLFWTLVWGGMSNVQGGVGAIVLDAILLVIVFGIGGAIVGFICAAFNLPVMTGAIVGVVAGLLFCGLEALLKQNSGLLINIFFWFVTGRYVGFNIALRIQRPVSA